MAQNKNNNIIWIVTLLIGVLSLMPGLSWSQKAADSLVINVGSSKIIFLVNDKNDLEKLKEYDLNTILEKLSLKLEEQENSDSLSNNDGFVSDTTIVVNSSDVLDERTEFNRDDVDRYREEYDDDDDEYDRRDDYDDRDDYDRYNDDNRYDRYRDDDNYTRDYRQERREERRRYHTSITRHFFNIDLGTNNYLMDGEFPDDTNEPYAVRPWGSWYVALSSTNQTHIAGPLYADWSFNISWYNFKFQNDRVLLVEGEEQVEFIENTDPNFNFDKSKLSSTYLNASLVPMFGFGRRDSNRRWSWKGASSFRIGAGAYAGYRLLSYTKVKFDDGNGTEKDLVRNNFFLNNFRYGIRAQIGFGSTDLFFNYDINELFQEGKGPKLNAFSFGITL